MAIGGFRVSVLTWTGDGSSSRAIAVPFPLNVGKVVVLAQDLITNQAILRTSAFAATQSKVCGSTLGTLVTTGITGFTASGFTIGNHAGINTTGHTYTALVLQDIAGGTYLNVGTYVGTSGAHSVTGVGFDPTDVIVWGRNGQYRSGLMAGGLSICMANTNEISQEITGLVTDGFSLGTSINGNTNNSGSTYYWIALKSTALAAMWKSFSKVGTGSAADTGSIGFAAAWAYARNDDTAGRGGFFRGPAHTGTQSSEWVSGSGLVSPGGIEAINSDTLTLGTLLLTNTKTAYGFAVKATSLPTVVSIAPTSGDVEGGTPVTITGTALPSDATIGVTFSGVAATSVVLVNATTLTCVTPHHLPPGAVDVVVMVTYPVESRSLTLAGAYTYTLADWLLINDAPAASKVRRENSAVQIHDVLNDAPNTASLTVQGQPGGPGPQGGSPLRIYDPATNTKIFKGSLQTIEQFYDEKPTQLGWHVTAVDAMWRLNKYRPFGVWEDVSASTVVLDLLADFAPGFTGDHVQTNLAPISITLDGSQTLSEAFTAICQAIGAGHWYVDYDDDLHLFHSVPPSFDVPRPPAPTTAATLSDVSGTLSLGPAAFAVNVAYRYADFTDSAYGPTSNVLARPMATAFQVGAIPIGAPDATHGAVIARLVSMQTLSTNIGGTGGNPARPSILFAIPDNTTTSVTWSDSGFTPPVSTSAINYLPPTYPPFVETLPAGPTPAVTVAIESYTEQPLVAPTVSDPGGSGPLTLGRQYEYVYTYSAGTSNTDHTKESVPSPASAPYTITSSGRVQIQVPHATVATGIAWVFCYRAVSLGLVMRQLIQVAAQPYTAGGSWGATFTDTTLDVDLGIPTRGPTDDQLDATVTGLSFTFALTAVYDNGVESLPGPWSAANTGQAVGRPLKKFHFSAVPVAADWTDPDLVVHPAVYRKLYARRSWTYPPAGLTFTDQLIGWMIVPDNVDTDFTDDGRFINGVFLGFAPDPLPANPRIDGPDPETDAAPDAITDATTTLLKDPPITLSEDFSQIRTRVYGRGGGSTAFATIVGAVSLGVTDVSPFSVGGGFVILGSTILHYLGVTGTYLALAEPLATAIAFGTVVSLWVQRDDLIAQAELGAVELDADGNPTDGVHEFTIVDTNLRSVEALTLRCDAELALFSRPIQTVHYATRDPNTRSGKRVAITLTTPPISGSFVIQDVTIDQIHFNNTLVARYTVTASSVRFTLDDLLQRVILSGTTGPGTGSSASSSGGSGGGSGGGGTVVNSGTLDDNHLILGDSGTRISALADLGTSTKVLHGNASGAPTFGAVNLAADVTGLLPAASVDFTGVTLGLTRAQVLAEAFLR